jgi:hypothetical protein
VSLVQAILYGTLEDVRAEVSAGANIHELDEFGYPPLAEAAIVQKNDIAEYLIGQGVEVDKPDLTGRTPLNWAVENNNIPLSRLLLSHHANPNSFTVGCQPLLVNPMLRNQTDLKKLLLDRGADIDFARDYINTKVLSHLFMLQGVIDIYTPENTFIELALEGFILEFTLSAIHNSLLRFLNHYSARSLRPYFRYIRVAADALGGAAELMHYQQYNTDLKSHSARIRFLLSQQPLLVPLAYEGHAVSFVQYGETWVRCDRGEYGREHGCINVGKIGNPEVISPDFFSHLIYTKQTRVFVTDQLDQVLGVQPVEQIPISEQTAGNCSWANIEASIPAILYLLFSRAKSLHAFGPDHHKQTAIDIFNAWRTWQQDIAIEECIESFETANRARKASKAALLGTILMQQSHFNDFDSIKRVDKIVEILNLEDHRYILQSYYDAYCKPKPTPGGQNLIDVLEAHGVDPDQFK